MNSVSSVRPKSWEEGSILDLYDDGKYSAIWGRQHGEELRSLGVRWNGSDDYPGYPNYGKSPVWYNEPEFLESALLNGLLIQAKAASIEVMPRKLEFIENILIALRECNV